MKYTYTVVSPEHKALRREINKRIRAVVGSAPRFSVAIHDLYVHCTIDEIGVSAVENILADYGMVSTKIIDHIAYITARKVAV